MYTPQNVDLYLRAFAGFMAGITKSAVTDPLAVNYTLAGEMADAYSQQLDIEWGSSAPTTAELLMIQSVSADVWDRSPLRMPDAIVPGAYVEIALAVVARALQGNAQIIAEGIDPNGSGSPGTGTVIGVTGSAPIVITGAPTVTPNVTITPATDVAAGSLSAADKTKLDGLSATPVNSVTASNGIASSGGQTPNLTWAGLGDIGASGLVDSISGPSPIAVTPAAFVWTIDVC